ncbi:hypothetical protein WP50_31755, partial [Lactiplantibacillus plantarum]
MAGIVALELGTNSTLMMAKSPLGNQAKFVTAYRTEYRQMQAVNLDLTEHMAFLWMKPELILTNIRIVP